MKLEVKKERQSYVPNYEGMIPEDRPVMVFAGRKHKDTDTRPDPDFYSLKFQVFRDYRAHIAKIASNYALSPQARQAKLNELARKFSTGWPFKNNLILDGIRVDNVPVLQRLASAASDQLGKREQAAVAPTTDLGKMGNQT